MGPFFDFKLAIEMLDCVERPQRQRLMQRELVLQVEIHAYPTTKFVGLVRKFEQAGIDERAIDRDRLLDVLALTLARFVVVNHQLSNRSAAITATIKQAHNHLMVDLEARGQRLGFATDHLLEGALVPVRIAPIRRLFLDHLLLLFGVLSGLLELRLVHHDVLGRLGPDRAFVIETSTPGTPSNLRELTVAQDARGAPVVFAELREQHRADRDVDANAQRVSTADDLEEAGLREPLHKESIFRQQPGVVHTDTCDEEPSEALAERRVKAESADQFFDPLLLVLRERVEADVALCCFGCVALREVNEVNRCPTRLEERRYRGMEQRRAVLEVERYRSLRRLHQGGLTACSLGQFVLEEPCVAECRRHQQELAVREFKDRQLPCPAALWVGVEVKLVGNNDVDISPISVPQRPVRQDLGRAADNRRVRVDRAVAGDHSHSF